MICPFCNGVMVSGEMEMYSAVRGDEFHRFISDVEKKKSISNKIRQVAKEIKMGVYSPEENLFRNVHKAYVCEDCGKAIAIFEEGV